FFQAEDGIRDLYVTGVQTCALPISEGTATTAASSPRPRDSRAGRSSATTETFRRRPRGCRAGADWMPPWWRCLRKPRRTRPSNRSEERRVGKTEQCRRQQVAEKQSI